MKKTAFIISLFIAIAVNSVGFAQAEPDDIALANDEFQNNYFEALKQKGIENYDRAITALNKCLKTNPNDPFIYNELGKNHLKLRQYKDAYEAFEKASDLEPQNRWYLHGMYDVCYETQDYNQAIIIVRKLIPFDASYQEDLTSLYMNTSQYDKALELINDLNLTVGKSEKREAYKRQILQNSKYQNSEKEYLLEMIAKNPKDENNYISLIYLYSNSNQEEKALEIAEKLEKEIPTSDWAQVSLFKFHLNDNDGDKAAISMKKALSSNIIDKKIKHRIINEFLIFVKNNPKYDNDLEDAITLFTEEKEVSISKEIGIFYQNKKDWEKAIKYYEMSDQQFPNEVQNLELLLHAYIETQQFEKIVEKTEKLLDLFPLQPEYYYYSGLANNQLRKHKKAKDILESGIDYVIENVTLEANFYIQIGEAFHGLGDEKKKEQYFIKAEKLLNKK